MKAAVICLAVGLLAEVILVVLWFVDQSSIGYLFNALHLPAFTLARAALPLPTGDSFPLGFFCFNIAIQSMIYASVIYLISQLVRRRWTKKPNQAPQPMPLTRHG